MPRQRLTPALASRSRLKRRMLEIIMAARAVDDVGLVFGEQGGVAARETVGVDGEHIFAEQFLAGEMGDGRAVAAVGIVAPVALEPVVHFAARVLEHFKFLRGLGDMDADAPFSFLRQCGRCVAAVPARWNRARAAKARRGCADGGASRWFRRLRAKCPSARGAI